MNINSIDPLWFNIGVVIILTVMWGMVEWTFKEYLAYKERKQRQP